MYTVSSKAVGKLLVLSAQSVSSAVSQSAPTYYRFQVSRIVIAHRRSSSAGRAIDDDAICFTLNRITNLPRKLHMSIVPSHSLERRFDRPGYTCTASTASRHSRHGSWYCTVPYPTYRRGPQVKGREGESKQASKLHCHCRRPRPG
jgi:hypothetical protein